MNYKTKILGLIAGVALLTALVLPAKAEVSPLDFSMTNTVAASTTLTSGLGNDVDVSNYEYADLLVTFQGLGADTATNSLTLVRTIDPTGTRWSTAPGITYNFVANGTNVVRYYIPIPATTLGAAAKLKLTSFANACTNGLTNIVVELGKKRIRF